MRRDIKFAALFFTSDLRHSNDNNRSVDFRGGP